MSTNQTYGGIRVQQTWEDLGLLEKVLTDFQPNVIIELGTGTGALASFFNMHAITYAYDNKDRVVKRIASVHYKTDADVFCRDIIHIIKFIIKKVDKVFLFCDNGNKLVEFLTYAPALKVGDMIWVHDYGLEIFEKDMKPAIEKNNLKAIPVVKDSLLAGFIKKKT